MKDLKPCCKALNTAHAKNNQLPLHAAAQHGNVEILELLAALAKPEEINGADKNKWTPLHFASAEGCNVFICVTPN